MSALLVSLVLGQIQVEATSCCPTTTARNIYNACRLTGGPRPVCAYISLWMQNRYWADMVGIMIFSKTVLVK
ncbi:hypothetical protein ACS0TY_016289 [Phlomoides rotata]